jgi:nicotinamidase-related amidase
MALPLPDFYQPKRVGTRFLPEVRQAIQAGQAAGLPTAESDPTRRLLLLIDAQIDFIHTDGALCVPGAIEDTRRTIEWLLRHVAEITHIICSLDSHVPFQIFYPTWWRDADGHLPPPYTPIAFDDVVRGRWAPTFETEWSIEYVRHLEQESKKQLMIWPYHTMIGAPGHNLEPSLFEALAYHSGAREAQPEYVIKGLIPKTEFYSLLEPEVQVPDDPGGTLNTTLLEHLTGFDQIYIAGQAKSHCVLETLATIVKHYGEDHRTMGKLHLLEDCMSSVVHPQVDFEATARVALDRYQAMGLKRLRSSDPLEG